MKYWLIILTLAIGIPFNGSSKCFMNMLGDKVEKRVDQIRDKSIEKSLKEVEEEFSKPAEVNSPNYNFILSAMIFEL